MRSAARGGHVPQATDASQATVQSVASPSRAAYSTPRHRPRRPRESSIPSPSHYAFQPATDTMKTLRSAIATIVQQEDINFLLTNRIPRRLATRFLGWFSQIENPVIRDLSIGVWRLFTDLDLTDAREERYRSLHDCFIRRLRADARPIDPDPNVLVSPCDAIIGASGSIEDGHVLQIKGFPYRLLDLLGNEAHATVYRNGCYVTLRLTSAMYHRFHAPHDCNVEFRHLYFRRYLERQSYRSQAGRAPVLQERTSGDQSHALSHRPWRYHGSRRGHTGREHSPQLPRPVHRCSMRRSANRWTGCGVGKG